MDAEHETHGHGGAREGAGRKLGRPSLRRAAQAIAEVEEAYPGWSPVLHLAAVANDDTLPPEVRLDAAKAAAPYLHSRPKPVEMEPDALVALERELIRVKLEETARAVKSDDSLADRLARAKARRLANEVFEVFDAMVEVAPTTTVQPLPAAPAGPAARPTLHEPRRDAPAAEPVVDYAPILPRPAPRAASDWSAPPQPWPDRQAFCDEGSTYDREPYGSLAAAYKPDF